jgi:hypothetical protein
VNEIDDGRVGKTVDGLEEAADLTLACAADRGRGYNVGKSLGFRLRSLRSVSTPERVYLTEKWYVYASDVSGGPNLQVFSAGTFQFLIDTRRDASVKSADPKDRKEARR